MNRVIAGLIALLVLSSAPARAEQGLPGAGYPRSRSGKQATDRHGFTRISRRSVPSVFISGKVLLFQSWQFNTRPAGQKITRSKIDRVSVRESVSAYRAGAAVATEVAAASARMR